MIQEQAPISPPRYSLGQLRQHVQAVLSKTGGGIKTAPSMATIKRWSAGGEIPAGGIDIATQFVVKRVMMSSSFGRVGFGAPNAEALDVVKGATSERADAPASIITETDMAWLKNTLSDIANLLQELVQRPVAGASSSNVLGELSSLLAAAKQMDDARKHMMVRHDAEIHLMRTQQPGAASSGVGMDILDINRLFAAISRIEGNLLKLSPARN